MALAPSYADNPVQAFPVSLNTFIGTANDETATNRSVLHAVEDVTCDFTMRDGSVLTMDIAAGLDVGLTTDVISVTSTGKVWIG